LGPAVRPAAAGSGKTDPDKIGDRDVGHGVNFYSIEKEMQLGKELAQQVEMQSHVLDDPVVSEYVNRVGQNLVLNSDAKVPFTIKVLDSDEVNAFALPGGYFYVNSGLILKAGSEAELAGVMAHEIAHVAARHATRQASRGEIANLATIPLIFAGGWAGYGIRQAAGLAVPLGFLTFSRGFESEADLLGLEYMYKAGYDPTAFVDFFEKLQAMEKKKPGTISKLFSTHPPTGDRIKEAQENIQKYLKPKPEYVVDTSEFERVKARLNALISHKRLTDKDSDRPTLRRRPDSRRVDQPSGGQSGGNGDDEGPPTLKRGN
jgi:predicted Zn-dependent protease